MSDDTYYRALGVSETATQTEIKAAYRSLLKKIHPDTVSTLSPNLRRMAEDATKEIIEAYAVLSDAGKRRQYDRRFGHWRQSAPAPATGSSLEDRPAGAQGADQPQSSMWNAAGR
jgi:DnaJ-class molecular chaperone